MALNWIPATVVRKTIWAHGLFTLAVRTPGVQTFETGQFLQLGFATPERHLHRPYSVASPHGDILEFFIVLVEQGEVTPKLWSLKVGDNVDVSDKGAGSFTLSHTPLGRDLWLMATGTGIAPYIAMLRTQLPWQRYQNIILVHGVRHPSDLAYQVELEELQRSYNHRFQYLGVVSRLPSPPEGHANKLLSGRITDCFTSGKLEQSANVKLSPENSIVMLCGNPAMLDEMEQLLAQRGLNRHKSKQPGQVVVERYW
jgi:ferredoxin--NADP+ reductase